LIEPNILQLPNLARKGRGLFDYPTDAGHCDFSRLIEHGGKVFIVLSLLIGMRLPSPWPFYARSGSVNTMPQDFLAIALSKIVVFLFGLDHIASIS
jgi:hypothetical protein